VRYLEQLQRDQPDLFGDVVMTKPTMTFGDELWIDGGDLTLHLFPTPGHTPDHIAIFIPQISTLLAGDAAEIPFPIIRTAADLPIARASLSAMAALQPQAAFFCHAPPEVGPQLLHDNIAYYDALEEACRRALARGLDLAGVLDGELPAALNCQFETVAPTTGAWKKVSPKARSERHGQQLRLMLAWIEGKQLALWEG
jgi:glyoxylase-like metal-dependent hydrolase (beta-lactamase superfamily II)